MVGLASLIEVVVVLGVARLSTVRAVLAGSAFRFDRPRPPVRIEWKVNILASSGGGHAFARRGVSGGRGDDEGGSRPAQRYHRGDSEGLSETRCQGCREMCRCVHCADELCMGLNCRPGDWH